MDTSRFRDADSPTAPDATTTELDARPTTQTAPRVLQDGVVALLSHALFGDADTSEDALDALRTRPDTAARIVDDVPIDGASITERLRSLGEPSPERQAAYWAALVEALGATPHTPGNGARSAADRDEWCLGQWFAELAEQIPAKLDGGPAGIRRLAHALQGLPRVPEDRVATLRATASARGAHDVAPGLDVTLAERGLTPLTFLRAARTVGHLLRFAVKSGTLAPDASVWISADGQLSGDAPLEADAAVLAVSEAGELPPPVARVLVQWLVAASEISPFLFLRRRTVPGTLGAGTLGADALGIRLDSLTTEEIRAGLDATKYAWTYHRRVNVYDGALSDAVPDTHISP